MVMKNGKFCGAEIPFVNESFRQLQENFFVSTVQKEKRRHLRFPPKKPEPDTRNRTSRTYSSIQVLELVLSGRKFMDKMNISQLSYSKHCILVHNNREYFINYRPIKNCIEILLSNSKILQHFIFKYENKKHQEEKSYAEQNSGNWWKYTEASIPSSAYILSLILYSDATTTDTLGKSSLHLIYISLENKPIWRRNKEDAKQLLGYFLILFAKNEKEKTSPEFKKLVRETFHKSLKFLLDSLFENENGIDYKINNRIIYDWLEAYTYSLTYKSVSSNFPCHFCLVQKNDLINTMQDQIILRNYENMMEHFNNNTGHSVTTVPDRMHHLNLGLYHYQIEFTKGIHGRSSIDKMNEKIGAIPRYPGLKIFSKGLQSIARLTASEHRDLMKVMVFVIDGLLSNDLSEVYVKWNEIYILSRLEIFKESDLEKFQAINEWANLFSTLLILVVGSGYPDWCFGYKIGWMNGWIDGWQRRIWAYKIGWMDDGRRKMESIRLGEHMAANYLAIPATSTSSEKLFSQAGNIMIIKRTQLIAITFENLIFCKKIGNWLEEFFQWIHK
ncbi:hypothetical protein Glove_242g192 [Diversispora epigaea]|uniref:HAT C-terminal dimerisation domain-containing protein n=1 Tax=Diversispora epigaea TaxID=1348612 RepID=A0A397ICA5_9GLOM|nr:hypothetical protein Glove_242g192 [Diversispora epigaea]